MAAPPARASRALVRGARDHALHRAGAHGDRRPRDRAADRDRRRRPAARRAPGKTLALRADIDALPITEDTGIEFASTPPGAMHACGHDGHTAMLLAAAKALVDGATSCAGEVRFLFQPAEEVPPGGARDLHRGGRDGRGRPGRRRTPVLDRRGREDRRAAGPADRGGGRLGRRGAGKGGHAAMPHQAVDPIVIASEVVLAFQQLVSRSVDPIKSAVVSVTRFEGGSAHNVIPEAVKLAGTVRTFDPEVRAGVRERMERDAARRDGGARRELLVRVRRGLRLRDQRRRRPRSSSARRAVAELGEDVLVDQPPIMGGEDFSAYLLAAPGASSSSAPARRRGPAPPSAVRRSTRRVPERDRGVRSDRARLPGLGTGPSQRDLPPQC